MAKGKYRDRMRDDYTIPAPAAEDVDAPKKMPLKRPCIDALRTGCKGEGRVVRILGRSKSRIVDDEVIISREIQCSECARTWVTNERSPITPG